MKQFLSCLLALIALFFTLLPFSSSALEAPTLTEGGSVLLVHNESGRVLYRSGEEEAIEAGPAARLLAALIYIEEFDDLSATVTVHRAVSGLATSTMNPGLKSKETISVYDLLCGMLIANSEDAVYALAYALFDQNDSAPSMMVQKMNETARALGMTDSRFLSMVGSDPKATEEDVLPEVNTTSLSDLLILANAARANETLTAICAMDQYTVPATDKSQERLLYTRNYLLSPLRIPGYTYEYATGLVAENSERAGYCVISTATFADKSFTAIVMGKTEKYGSFTDAKSLFVWANNNFSYRKVLDTTHVFGEIEVALSGDSDYIAVAPDKTLYAFLPNDMDLSERIRYTHTLSFSKLTAPVYEGLIVGKVEIFFGNESLGRADLVTTGSLALNNRYYYLALAENFLSSKQFLYICIALFFLLICYLLINARVRYLRANSPDALEFAEEEEQPFIPHRAPQERSERSPSKASQKTEKAEEDRQLQPPEQPTASEQTEPSEDSSNGQTEDFGIDDDYLRIPKAKDKKQPKEERDDTGGFAIPTPKRTLFDGETGESTVVEEEKKPSGQDEYVPDGWND